MVDRSAFQGIKCRSTGNSVALDNGLRVDLLDSDEFFCFSKEFRSENAD